MTTVAIVGGGFGGLACAQALAGTAHRVVLIDKRNYHLFQPLLYQVATAALSPAHIASPLRHVLARYDNVEVRLATVPGVDVAERRCPADNQPPPDPDPPRPAPPAPSRRVRPHPLARRRPRLGTAPSPPPTLPPPH